MQLTTLLGAAVAISGLANAAPRTFEERAGAAAKRRDYTHKSSYRSRQGLSNAGSAVEDGALKVRGPGVSVLGSIALADPADDGDSDDAAATATSWADPDDCGLPGGVVTVTRTVSLTVSPQPPATHKPRPHGQSWPNAPGSQAAPTGTESPDAPGTVTATATESESPGAPGTVTATETESESPGAPGTVTATETATKSPEGLTVVTATATLSKAWGQGHHPHQHHTWSRPAFNTTIITLGYNTTTTLANTTFTSEPCPDETGKPHKTWPVRNTTAAITSTVSLANATTPAITQPCNETESKQWWPKPTVSPLLNTTNATTSTPCPEEEATSTTVLPTTTDCPEDEMTSTTAARTTSTTDCPEDEMTSTTAARTTSTTDCPEDEMTSTTAARTTSTTDCPEDAMTSTTTSTFSSAPANATHSGRPPSHDYNPTGTVPVTVHASSSSAAASATAANNLTFTATSAASAWTASTTTCVIDTSVTPVTTAAPNATLARPTSTVAPTTTVCATDAPTGTPQTASTHCGVHGLPVGDYFLGRFVENSAGVPVTLEGCYQFCSSVWGDTHGCLSYDYYLEDGLGVPRCDLYGSPAAYALASIDNNEPRTWFDLACGDPTSSAWSHISS